MNATADFCITLRGERHSFPTPEVMGILNVTPDSFYEGSRKQSDTEIRERTRQILAEGATMIDVGAYSTRPGATPVSTEQEMARLRHALQIVRSEAADAIISVDTFRPEVARMCVSEFGADIINDVGAPVDWEDGEGERDRMFAFIAEHNTPYILMSRAATIEQMMTEFRRDTDRLHALGATNIILDPGYGFGKTVEQNYDVLSKQQMLLGLGCPILAGISRKRMIWQLLGTSASEALNGTTVVNALAVERGAHILRVHDVRAAAETIKIYNALKGVER